MTAREISVARQKGAAILLMMLGVILATATVLLANLSRDDLKTRRLTDARAVLAQAKEALLEYATVNPDLNPGQSISLPCPDLDGGGGLGDGQAHTAACGARGETMLGRLPWRTLGVPPLRDTASACLWYAVSGSFKNAGNDTAAMINADTNGQLRLVGLDTGDIIAGQSPEDRPVAMVVAPMRAVAGQVRPAAGGTQCSSSFDAGDFLDSDAASGVSNANIVSVADGIDELGRYPAAIDTHNDIVVTITRDEVATRLYRRPDFLNGMRDLGLGAAACLANYAGNNPGGNDDRRLPWPSPVDLGDYRDSLAYDDDPGLLGGRLPDAVDDSNSSTGNSIDHVLSDCDPAEVPGWSAAHLARWQHWKDHFFYVVAEAFSPAASVPSNCGGGCVSVNGAGSYAALVLFAGARLDGQVRNAPPTDTDTRDDAANYLEASNAANLPVAAGTEDYASQPGSDSFNDLLFCIDNNLNVSEC